MIGRRPARIGPLQGQPFPYDDVHLERLRATEKHGLEGCETRAFDDPRFLSVLTEELGEVARVLNDLGDGTIDRDQARRLMQAEATQLAAMASALMVAAAFDHEVVNPAVPRYLPVVQVPVGRVVIDRTRSVGMTVVLDADVPEGTFELRPALPAPPRASRWGPHRWGVPGPYRQCVDCGYIDLPEPF